MANSVLKKYFVLCGIEKAFPNFHVLNLKKSKVNIKKIVNSVRKSICINETSFLIWIHTEWAIFHWIEKKNHFFYSYLVHLDQSQKSHRLVHALSGWEMTKILFWTRSLGKLLGGDQTIIMILFGAICQNTESSIWSLFSSWVTAVVLKTTFIFTPQFFLSQFKGEFWSENAMNCLMMRKMWSQKKGEVQKLIKSCRNFASWEVRAKCGWIIIETIGEHQDFILVYSKEICLQDSIFLAINYQLYLMCYYCAFIRSLLYSTRYVLNANYKKILTHRQISILF